MRISLNNISKKYKRDVIFQNLSFEINYGDRVGIAGPNGSGKSTLLKVISAQTSLSKGEIIYTNTDNKIIDHEEVYNRFNFVAPYIELIEEFDLIEILSFHSGFRKSNFKSMQEIAELSRINWRGRYIKDYSSGMKQRAKILLALCFESDVVMLDEPSTNLDVEGIAWVKSMLNNHLNNRTLIIASNEVKDFDVIDKQLDIRDYKN